MTRKEVLSEIKRRVARGESKAAIFSRYEMTEWENAAAHSLAIQVTIEKRRKWRWLNLMLVGCLSAITIFKVLDMIAIISSQQNIRAGAFIILLGLAVNIAVLVAVIRYAGIAYIVTAALLLQGIPKIMEAAGKMHFATDIGTLIFLSNAAFAVIGICLAVVLHRLLLPNTTFFLSPRKNAMGHPTFEN